MSILESIVQAVVQGLSEFLPISSSGHLSLVQHLFGIHGDSAVLFMIILHVGTLVAVVGAFYKLIWALLKEVGYIFRDIFTGKFSFKNRSPERNMIFMLIIALLPLLIFYPFNEFFTGLAGDGDILVEGVCFLVTAGMLFIADHVVQGNKTMGEIRVRDSLLVGTFQGVALLPGVSRSGSTISGAMISGVNRETAVQFSFLLGIPAIIGGAVFEIKDVAPGDIEAIGIMPIVIGFVVAAVVGFLSIKMVQWLIKSDKFKIFYWYTGILGVLTIIMGIIEHITGRNIAAYIGSFLQ